MNGSRAGELGLENALSAKTKSGASSDRTNIQLHGRIEAQQAVPVYQHGLVSPQGLLDNGPHCYEEGPFSVFNRLYDEVEPAATKGHRRTRRVEPPTDVRHGVSHPNGSAEKGIPQGNDLPAGRHVDRNDDTGIVGCHPDVALFEADVAVGELEERPATGQPAKGLSEARQLALHLHTVAHVGHGTGKAHDFPAGTDGKLNDLGVGADDLVVRHAVSRVGRGGRGHPQLVAFQHNLCVLS
mmetsp:Transcript_13721/g.28906  ORF Transcript_13721/g.28906 Transcript_13721/m.28906 type:complete len:240 (+) Transcript_13721:2599-3318(+)